MTHLFSSASRYFWTWSALISFIGPGWTSAQLFTVLTPDGGSALAVGLPTNICWNPPQSANSSDSGVTAAIAPDSTTSVDIMLMIRKQNTWTESSEITYNVAPSTNCYSWTVANVPDGYYAIRVGNRRLANYGYSKPLSIKGGGQGSQQGSSVPSWLIILIIVITSILALVIAVYFSYKLYLKIRELKAKSRQFKIMV